MRYLNSYKIYENKNDIASICRKYYIQNYTIRPDGLVDVDGGVNLYSKGITELPLKFGIVTGGFLCSYNQLKSLEGAPSETGGDFDCSHNVITSLEHCPSEVGDDFWCNNNELTSLKGAPEEVGGVFYCNENKITSLEYCPSKVRSGFNFRNNQITSLEHCPSQINGNFYCDGNPVNYLIPSFSGSREKNKFVELFNDADIIQDDTIIYDRLVWFYEEIGIQLPNIHEIEKYYTIIR